MQVDSSPICVQYKPIWHHNQLGRKGKCQLRRTLRDRSRYHTVQERKRESNEPAWTEREALESRLQLVLPSGFSWIHLQHLLQSNLKERCTHESVSEVHRDFHQGTNGAEINKRHQDVSISMCSHKERRATDKNVLGIWWCWQSGRVAPNPMIQLTPWLHELKCGLTRKDLYDNEVDFEWRREGKDGVRWRVDEISNP